MTTNNTVSSLVNPDVDVDDRVAPICLVGDQFSGMTAVPGVHTLGQFIGDLSRGAAVPRNIILGQGLQEYELDYLYAALRRTDVDPSEVIIGSAIETRVSRHLVHKHREQNVLLADLRKTNDRQFTASIRLHGENELFLDHQTGQHVQGMVVTEALRQMFIAVFEFEYGVQHPHRRYYIVWNSISLRFNSFLFPLPADLTCDVLELEIDDPAKMVFRVAMQLDQLGTDAAYAEIEFAAVDDDRIKRSEMRRATSGVEALMKSAVPQTVGDQR